MLEHHLFYIKMHTPQALKPFLMAVRDYYSFGFNELNHIIDTYTLKQYFAMIPRRHGQSKCSAAVAAAMIVPYPRSTVLIVAQKKAVKNTNRKITNCVSIWVKENIPNMINTNKPSDDTVEFMYSGMDSIDATKLHTVSAYMPTSLRGYDPTLVIVDEAMCVKDASHTVITAYNQKRECKTVYLSSPTPKTKLKQINLVTSLCGAKNTNIYRITYCCGADQHITYALKQDGCVNMIFYKPDHMTFSDENKMLQNILTNGSNSYESELGNITNNEFETAVEKQKELNVVVVAGTDGSGVIRKA